MKVFSLICLSVLPSLHAASEKQPLVSQVASSHSARLGEEKRLELVNEIVALQTSSLNRNISEKRAKDTQRKTKIKELFYPNGAWDRSEDCAKKFCVEQIRDDIKCTESCNILSGCGVGWCTLIGLVGFGIVFSNANIGLGMFAGGVNSALCCGATFAVNDTCKMSACCDRYILDRLSNPDMWPIEGETALDAPQPVVMRDDI